MRSSLKYCAGLVLTLTSVLLVRAQLAGDGVNAWTKVADLSAPRAAACAARIPDGRVVVAGGMSQYGAVKAVDVYATDGSVAPAAPMLEARASAACVVLGDGRVLAIGGSDGTGALSSAEIYDPQSDSWTAASSMAIPRAGHTATVSPWGAIIVAGGEPSGTVEMYLTNGVFTTLGKLASGRTGYAVAAVPGHKILFIGGSEGAAPTASIEMVDADRNQLAPIGTMLAPRQNLAASVLYDGTVLITGGIDAEGKYLASTEIFDPSSGRSTPGPAMATARANHQSIVLPNNGQVLLAGGENSDGALASSEIYAPWNGKISGAAGMQSPRSSMTASQFHRGSVLVAGGKSGNGYLSGAEQYRFATVESGKSDYHPGEVAGFTGTGWKPGEQVLVVVQAFPLDQHNIEFNASTLAGSNGQIDLSGFTIDRSHIGKTFLTTATGSQSQAQTIFTDAANATVTTLNAPAPNANITYGGLSVTGTVANTDFPATGVTAGAVTLSIDGVAVSPSATFGAPLATFSWSDSLCALPLTCVNGHLSAIPKSHTVAATYTCTGSCLGQYQNSSSGTIGFNVVDTVTITNVHPVSPGDNTSVGGTVPFTATVTGDNGFGDLSAYGASAGSVTFTETGTSPVTAPIPFGPVPVGAAQSTNSLAANIYTTSVTFSPSTGPTGSGFQSKTTSPGTVAVGKASTTTSVTSTPLSPVNWGQAFTFTSTTTTSATTSLTIIGAVTIQDGGAAIPGCTGIGAVSGVMTCTPTLPFAPGAHSITAVFDPTGATDPNFATSASSTYTFTVNPTPTSVTLTASASPVNLGQSITYTAHITLANSSGSVPPLPGSVAFTDGSLAGPNLCTVPSGSIAPVDSTHFTAACLALYDGSNAAHATGPHSIFVKYAGGPVVVGGVTGAIAASDNSAAPLGVTVNPDTIAFGAIAPSAASVIYATGGATLSVPYALGGTVAVTPSQNFQVLDGPTVLSPTLPPAASPLSYSLNPVDKAVGSHSLTVKYPAGDPNFAPATSAPAATFTVTQATPAFSSFNFSNNVPFGGTVSFAASVGTGNAGADSPAAPTGTLTFKAGAATLASCTLTAGACNGSYTGSALPAGTNAITTVYGGDTNYTTLSDATHSVTIVRNSLNGTLSTNPPNSAPAGTTVGITSVLTPAGGGTGTPTGVVTFYDGSTAIGTAALSSGAASMNIGTLSAGTHTLTISYPGDSNFLPIAQGIVITTITITNSGGNVNNFSVTLASSPTAPTIAQPITLAVSVTTTASTPPKGTVQFFDGTILLGTVTLTGGQASLTVTLSGGGHNLIAVLTTDSGIQASSLPYGLYVYRLPCTIAASASQPIVVYGQAATFGAQLSAQPPTGFGAPTGQVQFFDGSTVIGAGTVAGGAVAINAPALDVGVHQISAYYPGDNTWNTCKSPAATYTVKQASTVVTATALPDVSAVQATLTLTANVGVVLPGGGVPGGTVQFVDPASNAVLANAPVTGGIATAILTQPNVARQVVATYSGNVDYIGATSPAATEITITNAASFASPVAAADAILSIFGFNLADAAASAAATPLPDSLGGSTVNIKDSSGAVLPAQLFYASPTQINLLVPSGTAAGPATATVTNSKGVSASIVTTVGIITPGIFAADFTGKGVAAAQIVRVHADGSQVLEPVAVYDPSTQKATPVAIDLSKAGDTLYLVLYGTGLRHGPGVSGTTVTVNGQVLPVTYAGAQPVFFGLDQVNVGPLPASFAGAGTVDVQATVSGQAANTVTVMFK